MGVLCDIFIADEDRALMYNYVGECGCRDPYTCKCWQQYREVNYDRIDSCRIYDREFSKLLALLRGKTWKPSQVKQFKMLKSFDADGPWIHGVPDDLPRLLADTKKTELLDIAKEWIELIDLISPSELDPDVFYEYLIELRALSKKARKNDYGMYLWVCL